MWLQKILCTFLFLFPISILGQSIQENLDYINVQFEKFNKYDTSFDVDKVEKKIVCHDKFGVYSASFEAIEFRVDSLKKSIGMFCIDGSKRCISSKLKDGRKGLSFYSYTMELAQNEELIPDAGVIIEKFSLIKKAILESEFINLNSPINVLKYDVELQLQDLNAIFEKHSQNQNKWSFDWDNYWLIGETASCKVQIPLEKITIDYYERENVQNFRHGFVFKSEDSEILENCTNFENNVNKTQDYLDNLSSAEAAINYFKTIQKLVIDGPSSLSPPLPHEEIDQLFDYINEQFKKYNKFNTRFFIDLDEQELVWIQEFGESRAPLDMIDFEADYKQGWFVIYCKDGRSKCVTSTNPKGKKIQNSEYSMSLMENDKVIPHIDDVINKFKELIQELTD
jgi:hypothetical protein